MATMTSAPASRFWLGCGAAAALVAGYFLPHHQVLQAGPNPPSPAPTIPTQLLAASADPDGVTPTASPAQPTSALKQIVVYVCGAVRKPGVYRLQAGLRVADGIARAGGAGSDADLEQLNLAEPLTDGMKLSVPRKEESLLRTATAMQSSSSVQITPRGRHQARGGHRSGGRSTQKLQPGQTLNVNTATEAELESLPGVGPSLARRIVEYRQANGPFQTADDLQNVSGIGPSKFDKMADFIRL
jgi:competence protein ComEA